MVRWVREHRKLLAVALVLGGAIMVPWLIHLSLSLPRTARAHNWSVMWTGLDVAEAFGLVLTGILLWRRDDRRSLVATVTAVLLVLDAWVDVTTSGRGAPRLESILFAGFAEIPTALVCALVAWHTFPGSASWRKAAHRSGELEVIAAQDVASDPLVIAGLAQPSTDAPVVLDSKTVGGSNAESTDASALAVPNMAPTVAGEEHNQHKLHNASKRRHLTKGRGHGIPVPFGGAPGHRWVRSG